MTPSVSTPLQRGFTLVEMLIVIAIIALLSAILLPVFSRSRALGRRTTCSSNLKQIWLAMDQYAQDTRVYPNMSDYTRPGQNQAYCSIWANKLSSYVRSNSIFECPSFPQGVYRSDCPVVSVPGAERITYRGSYDINLPNTEFLLSGDPNGSASMTFPPGTHFSPLRFTRPSSTILVLDGDGYFVSPGYQEPAATDTATLVRYGINAHHEGGVNAAFADGHVKYLSLDALLKRSLWQLNGPE